MRFTLASKWGRRSRARHSCAQRAVSRLLASSVFVLLAIVAPTALADEDSAEDHGSRAARRADAEQDDTTVEGPDNADVAKSPERSQTATHKKPKKKKQGKHKKKRKKKARDPLSLAYGVGLFGGSYLQGPDYGVLGDASVEGNYRGDDTSVSLELSYGFDPFSTKTFNFPEEEASTSEARLTQAMHELAAVARLGHDLTNWLELSLRTRADLWLPQQDLDERRSVRAEPEVRFGSSKGPYASVAADFFYKQFPNYEIQDRRLDQRGVDGTIELGYSFAAYNRVAVGSAIDYTEYLDARYDVLASDGTIERSDESKRYFERSPFIFGSVRPIKQFRASVRYSFELNDAIDYDRRMTGRVDGTLVAKFIPDYYDYTRHRISLNTVTDPLDRLQFRTLTEVWFRDFDSYEARDADNAWTGELRHDFNLEGGLEVAYRFFEFEALGIDHGLYVSAFASHLHRRSNMKREASIATNFDITRAFLGIELRSGL